MLRQDPTDWANKRKVGDLPRSLEVLVAEGGCVGPSCLTRTVLLRRLFPCSIIAQAAAERAKQLREERKRGVADEGDTFTPQINRRPSYLNNAVKVQNHPPRSSSPP